MSRAPLWLLLAAACGGPAHRPPPRPSGPPRVARAPAQPGRPGVVVGFVCPEGAAGRPILFAAAVRAQASWTAEPAEVRAALSGGKVRELDVQGYNGRRAGRFMPLGPTAGAAATALGAYAGASPCADEPTATECRAASAGCGLATGLADLEEAPRVPARDACAAGGLLMVDIDGDGKREAFAVAELAAALEEVGATPGASETCRPRPAGPLAENVDLLGVADLDLDGRVEVAVAVRQGGHHRAAIYSAGDTPARLDLVGVVDLP